EKFLAFHPSPSRCASSSSHHPTPVFGGSANVLLSPRHATRVGRPSCRSPRHPGARSSASTAVAARTMRSARRRARRSDGGPNGTTVPRSPGTIHPTAARYPPGGERLARRAPPGRRLTTPCTLRSAVAVGWTAVVAALGVVRDGMDVVLAA